MSSKKTVTVFPEEKSTIARDTSDTITSILESYNEKGKQFATEGINYSAITLITTISNLYLIKKYNTNCFMYGNKGLDENFLYGGIILSFSEGQIDQPIDRIIPDMLTQINSKNLLLDVEATIVVSESTIKYSYVRDSYKTITVDTQQTSGIFTKGTITRSYVTADKSIRKLVYKPFI